MKRDIMERWGAALRSGEFKQGRGYLARDGQHCCLGVLCELAAAEGVSRKVEKAPGTFGFTDSQADEPATALLPDDVRQWAGVANRCGAFVGSMSGLDSLNDDGMPFAEIADLIERHWSEL